MNSSEIKCPKYKNQNKMISSLINKVKNGMNNGSIKKRDLVWLELNGCSGNIISLLNGSDPDFQYLISEMTNFIYSNSLIATEGSNATNQLFDVIGKDYILAVEGAVSTKDNGVYQYIGRWKDKEVTGLEAVKRLGENATNIIAVGACASHGGVSAARPNPTECVGVQSVLNKKVIQLPGCPCHPDWFMGTLSYILLFGEPPLDSKNRPLMFYSKTIHDQCPRRSYFDRGIFATKLGEKTCMFKLGCRGPVTPIDCPLRKWNERVNWPIGDDSPCIGCAQFGFPDAMEPFISYDTTKGE